MNSTESLFAIFAKADSTPFEDEADQKRAAELAKILAPAGVELSWRYVYGSFSAVLVRTGRLGGRNIGIPGYLSPDEVAQEIANTVATWRD
jgi:hypothetical protein